MFSKYLALAAVGVQAGQSLQITENGKPKTIWLDSTPGGSAGQINMPHNNGARFHTADGAHPDSVYSVNWIGGSLDYDVNLSQSGCSCNAALYLVSMPAKDNNGNYSGGNDGTFYCDANKVNGQWCPEFDIMEANKYAWHTTPHTCDSPTDKGHYNNCDRGGSCFVKAWERDSNAYGPGKRIDTNKDFHVKFSFGTSNFKVEMTQGSNSFVMDTTDCGNYYQKMAGDLARGMTIVVSNWGEKYDTMSWLDADTGCQGECYNNPMLYVKNIAIKTGSGPVPPPTPPGPSGNYDYGDVCKTKYDDDCNGCDCHWSWPQSDPAKWASKDAHCRCKA